MIVMVSVASLMGVLISTPLKAQSADLSAILAAIKKDTGDILAVVQTLPSKIDTLTTSVTGLVVQWTGPDTSTQTAQLQSSFGTLSNINAEITQIQKAIQPQLASDIIISNNIKSNVIPDANDLLYQSLLGNPYFNPDPRNTTSFTYGYIRNASGLGITHAVPSNSWQGKTTDQTKYRNYFNTIMAVQSYNAYILSQMYAETEAKKSGKLSDMQTSLMNQASNSGWFALIGSESIGLVLRQILMYNSQVYVLMVQSLQTQKQLVTTQAMTNALLILGNQFTENSLLEKAAQRTP